MVNNQNEFNNKHKNNKEEVRKIKLINKDFSGQLVIEDFPKLENLNLRDNGNISKIILKNLPQLQECTIWNCGTQDLIIANCSQIKKLKVRSNLLTSLEFLKSLENLEELEIDGNTNIDSGLEHLPKTLKTFSYENTKLTEFLKLYKGDWKSYQKDLQELIELVNNRPHELLKEIKNLKERQPITIDNLVDFEKKYRKLKGTLCLLTKGEELKSKEIDKLVTSDILENVKELRDDLSKTQKIKKKLEEKLASFEQFYFIKKQEAEKKEKELEELKNNIKIKLNDKELTFLEELLELQDDLIQSNSSFVRKQLEKSKNQLGTKLTNEEIEIFCQKQRQITKLKLEIQRNFNQINIDNRTINQQIKYIQGINVDGSHVNLTNARVEGNTMKAITYEEEVSDTELQAAIEAS